MGWTRNSCSWRRRRPTLRSSPRFSEECTPSKGTSGFVPLNKLQAVAHAGENLLSLLRDRALVANAETISALLAMIDAVRFMVGEVEATGEDGSNPFLDVIARLNSLASIPTPWVAAPAESTTAPTNSPNPVVVPSPATKEPLGVATDTEGAAKASSPTDSTVRVDVGLLDRVMNLVGELVLARNQIMQYAATVKHAGFADASQRLNLLTTELHESVMKTRMQPIGTVWNKFPRVTRDLALSCGKKLELHMEGDDTELDRTIIEAIKDPLTHAVRNAIDHGIEQPEVRTAAGKSEVGQLMLRAYHEGGQVNVEISDDGGGLDIDRIRAKAIDRKLITPDRASRMSDRDLAYLIFQPGFSTAPTVTNVSGRGVGMDVVKTNIERIGGTVDVSSRRGHGTTLKIKLPLTLAIVPALIVTSRLERFAIPQVNLLELVRLEPEQLKELEHVSGTAVYRLRGNLLPLVFLDHALKLSDEPRDSTAGVNIVVLQADDRQFGLVVDAVHDTEEIVVKPLGKALKEIREFSGATIMGDGRVALILDVLGLAQRANVVSASERQRAGADQSKTQLNKNDRRETMLSFEAGQSSRLAMPLSLVARLEEIDRDRVENASGRSVVQYRGDIMPLIPLSQLLGAGGQDEPTDAPLQVIVFAERQRSVGLVVNRILDVVEDNFQISNNTNHSLLRGSTVMQGRVTDLLDVHGVIRQCEPAFFESPSEG